ncbi:MAG: proline dehydrogenase [Gemmatimonadetes bacterium]|nr:proline dehydrogenase [Gemmatimonadota bacterium]NIO32156.1 proline dehydrogenase [Gemmatimonadota bacterium]
MLRSILLYLSEQERLQNFVLRSRFARKRSRRFVAGETLDEAIAAARDLNRRGMDVTLDHLGESVESEDQANKATDDYIRILDRLAAESGAEATISIKPTQIGLAIDRELCLKNMRRLAETADALGNFVRMDMEASCYVDTTLSVFYELFGEFENIGAVIQSYLRRSEEDVRELARRGAPVRLCKGAYKEPARLAFQKKQEINDSYVKLLEILMDSQAPIGIATHDDLMIDAGKRLIRECRDRKAPVEFQMLYGIRRDMQARLIEQGYGMRVYVPYGNEWYPYFMRRLAERPANLFFALRAMRGK